MRNTEIIATLGPATESPEMITKLAAAGVNIFRFNLSHGEQEWHDAAIARVRALAPAAKILLDTRGPEIRLGKIAGEIVLTAGEEFFLVTDEEQADTAQKKIFVGYQALTAVLKAGDSVAIDGGMLFATVIAVAGGSLRCRAENGWTLTTGRHVNLPGARVDLPVLTTRDEEDLRFLGAKHQIDYLAMSFVRTAADVARGAALLPKTKIIAKIENAEGVSNFSAILAAAFGVMVARGDLGVETPLERIPVLQRKMVREVRTKDKFVIVATEMLESMVSARRPTRAEVSDIATAVWEKADAVMLSQETAMGAYPLEAVGIMRKVIEYTEEEMAVLP